MIKAVRLAAAVGVEHVITSEGDPKTAFGHNLTDQEALFLIRERLYEPLRIAADHGVKILLEPHGKYTDSIDHMEKILELCDSPALGVNFDSGNSWLGAAPTRSPWSSGWPTRSSTSTGRTGRPRWKPTAASSSARGMSGIPLGTGAVDAKGVFNALVAAGYDGYSTLEVAGDAAVLQSCAYLKALGAE
ncbi:MAG: sugar phosphate isomerase/epimerase [Comamonadaceae bacterium]|nr:sugar phosphate isomerase/epimerase [Comamonadaceae bacterium]